MTDREVLKRAAELLCARAAENGRRSTVTLTFWADGCISAKNLTGSGTTCEIDPSKGETLWDAYSD